MNAARVAQRVDDRFLRALVGQVTAGFGGKVALAPRIFLRELVDVLDRVDQHEAYDPAQHYRLDLDDAKLTAEELSARHGTPLAEQTEEPEAAAPKARRLDG